MGHFPVRCHELSITNFPRLDCFFVSSFPMSCSGFPVLFLPISLQVSSLSVIFPIRGQLFHSYNLYQISRSQFSSLLDCFSASLSQFLYELVPYFLNLVPLISLMSYTPTVKSPILSLFISLLLLFQFSSFLPVVILTTGPRDQFHIDISSRLWVIGVSNVENRTHTHTRTHAHTGTRTRTHTSGRQLKITFLDVLDYSEYSDTNISKFFFSTKT